MHGSFEVGMLRDCKAVICFGSRVVFEVVGEEGGEVGDGVGERGREGEDAEVVMKMKMKRERMNKS